MILCEALIDALTFWCAGYRNVTASYGVEGFTADHLALFKQSGIQRVLIAYDRDEAGERAAQKLAAYLNEAGPIRIMPLLPLFCAFCFYRVPWAVQSDDPKGRQKLRESRQ